MEPPETSTSTDVTPARAGRWMAQTTEAWCAYRWHEGGLQIPSLRPLDRLLVRTCHSLYEVIVLDPWRSRVMVRGGRFFPEFTPAAVEGSSLGGGFLKQHGIYAGFRVELRTAAQVIVTSPVRSLSQVLDSAPM